MEERKYSKFEISNVLNQLKLSNLEKSLFEKLDSLENRNVTPQIQYGAEKYLKGKTGKRFNRAEDNPDYSFFKLINEKDGTAQFTFHGDDREAIAKRVFNDDICDIISGSYQNSNSVKVLNPGEIKYVNEGWEVTKRINIALENQKHY